MAVIDTLTFSRNAKGDAPGETVSVPNVLLIVGPNESGKSYALGLICGWYDGSFDRFSDQILSSATLKTFDEVTAKQFLGSSLISELDSNSWAISIANNTGGIGSKRVEFSAFCDGKSSGEKSWRSSNLSPLRLFPDLNSMTQILQDTDARVSHKGSYQNLHQKLLSDSVSLEKVNRIIRSASGFNLVVETATDGKFRFLFHHETTAPASSGFVLSDEMVKYYSEGHYANRFGSGMQAFFGLVLSVFPFEHKLIFLDEPELHLHSPLVRRLAQELVREVIRRKGQLIVATHSPDFVLSCIANTDEVAMVRLTYSKATGRATSKVVAKDDLRPFVLDRVVRNTDALSGVFHQSVIVVEGVFEKIVFSEFNRCLLEEGMQREISDPHFVSGGGCGTVLNVAHVMRRTGTPTAMIVDFDFLRLGWSVDHIARIGIPHSEVSSVLAELNVLKEILDKAAVSAGGAFLKQKLRNEGIDFFDSKTKQKCVELLDVFESCGLFILRHGDLEQLVSSTLNFKRENLSKEQVLIDIALKRLEFRKYEIPSELNTGDTNVWRLLYKIKRWLG